VRVLLLLSASPSSLLSRFEGDMSNLKKKRRKDGWAELLFNRSVNFVPPIIREPLDWIERNGKEAGEGRKVTRLMRKMKKKLCVPHVAFIFSS
jgi:hypothetical protein